MHWQGGNPSVHRWDGIGCVHDLEEGGGSPTMSGLLGSELLFT